MKNIELLSPAGNFECLKAAIEGGTDAIYLGVDRFNARLRADNFTMDNIEEAIDYIHLRGVKAYLTLNTLIKNSEMDEALETVNFAYQKGIDGIIVQDLGLTNNIFNNFKDLPLHASTQMTIYDLKGVNLLEKIGFKRVVLSRETSLEKIKEITNNTNLDIEVFTHGALCASYSGQCLMSSFIGKRSGNRGECAQPCRLKYEIGDSPEKLHYLSLKDLCTIDDIEKIIKSNVKSLKIEGRMKSPEYVYSVVSSYKSAIKGYYDKDYKNYMAKIYNRGNFTKGFILNSKNDISYPEKPNNCGIYAGKVVDCENNFISVNLSTSVSIGDVIEAYSQKERNYKSFRVTKILKDNRKVGLAYKGEIVSINSNAIFEKEVKIYKVYDKNLMKDISIKLKSDTKKVALKCLFKLKKDENPIITLFYKNDKIEFKGESIPEVAINKPLTKTRLISQLNKTKNTSFEFEKIDVNIDEGLILKASEINSMRREALEILKNNIIKKSKRSSININKRNNFNNEKSDKDMNLSVCFNNWEKKYDLSKINAKRFYMPIDFFIKNEKSYFRFLKNRQIELFLWIPPITKDNYWKAFDNNIKSLLENNIIDGILVSNYSQLEKVETKNIYGNYNFNIFNDCSINKLKELGLKGITYSLELNGEELSNINSDLDSEIVVYGRIPLMYSEYCVKRAAKIDCNKNNIELKDKMNFEFPVICDKLNCVSIIFNSKILYLKDNFDIIKKINPKWIRIYITDENLSQIINITNEYNGILGYNNNENTIYNEEKVNYTHTKGHYYRGV